MLLRNKSSTKLNTRLTTAIELTDGKAMYDESCKKILADKAILAYIMKECVEEYADVDVTEIAERYIEGVPDIGVMEISTGKTIKGLPTELIGNNTGKIFFDIRYHATAPKGDELIELMINIEAQNDQYPGYPLVKRGIFYDCLMITSQYGTEFDKLDYNQVKKSYSIWLCRNAPKHLANSITAYELNERNIVGNVQEKREHYDLLTVVMVHLGHVRDEQSSELLNLFNKLFSEELRAKEKLELLEDEYNILSSEELESEVIEMCNWSKTVEDTAGKRGYDRGHAKGQSEGRIQGHIQGLTQGQAEGIAQRNLEIAQMSLANGLDIKMITAITGLDVSVIESLASGNQT